jgi:hypothetical protein
VGGGSTRGQVPAPDAALDELLAALSRDLFAAQLWANGESITTVWRLPNP